MTPFRTFILALSGACWAGSAARADALPAGLDLDFGATAFVGLGGYVADDTGAGDAAWRRAAQQLPLYVLGRISVSHRFDDATVASLFVRVKPAESPGIRTDVLPDADEIVKDAYLRVVTPSWGEFRLGYQANVRTNEAYYAPQACNCVDGFFGTNTAEATLAHGPIPENSTAADIDSRAPKLAWYSPAIAGFRMAASYAPERSMGRQIDGRLDDLGQVYAAPGGAMVSALHDDQFDEFWSLAIEWQGRADDIGFGAESGVTGAEQAGRLIVAGRNDAAPFVWDLGVDASYAAWKIGGAYEQQNFIDLEGIYGAAAYQPLVSGSGAAVYLPPATNGIITKTFDMGASYTIGPVTLGAAWSRGIYEGLVDAAQLKAGATNDVVFGGGQYQVDDHAAILAGLEFNRYRPTQSGDHPLPRSAALDLVYGGSDPGLNIWDRRYSGIALVLGLALRF